MADQAFTDDVDHGPHVETAAMNKAKGYLSAMTNILPRTGARLEAEHVQAIYDGIRKKVGQLNDGR